MQMVRIYREQRAAYEYVKWEMKQNEREREREREMCGGGVRSGAGLNENGNGRDRGWYLASFRGKYDRKGEEDTNGKVERRLMIDDRRLLSEQVGSEGFIFECFSFFSVPLLFRGFFSRENQMLG